MFRAVVQLIIIIIIIKRYFTGSTLLKHMQCKCDHQLTNYGALCVWALRSLVSFTFDLIIIIIIIIIIKAQKRQSVQLRHIVYTEKHWKMYRAAWATSIGSKNAWFSRQNAENYTTVGECWQSRWLLFGNVQSQRNRASLCIVLLGTRTFSSWWLLLSLHPSHLASTVYIHCIDTVHK